MSTTTRQQHLFTIPLEILEHIAYRAGTSQLSGPPADLISLSSSCKELHNSLALSRNPTLYAAIFSFKFDTDAIRRRRLDQGGSVTAAALSLELSRRFVTLKRLRRGDGSQTILSDCSFQEDDLWLAILMMLENDNKNAMQLNESGKISEWLKHFFLEDSGGSHVLGDIGYDAWPKNTFQNHLALWLLYLCDNAGIINSSKYIDTYRAFAIGANRVRRGGIDLYPITPFTWSDFRHPCISKPSEVYVTEYLGQTLHLTCPSIALPAILGHLAQLKEPTLWRLSSPALLTTFRKCLSANRGSGEWDLDWERWKPSVVASATGSNNGSATMLASNIVQQYVFSNVFEGTWEGLFTYMNFDVFAAILAGQPPHIATDDATGQNLHIWKLREYHLCALPSSTAAGPFQLLPPGPPQNGFFPPLATITELKAEGQLIISHELQSFVYTRGGKDRPQNTAGVWDIILIGEGHSAWGEMRLRGRVRARDGLVTILKEYNGRNERGKWLYRGYLLGSYFVGRWRDTTTPTNMVGYEGGFELHKRS